MGSNKKEIKRTHICLGDFNKKIVLLERAITPVDDPDYTQEFTTVATLWAAVETVSTQGGGVEVFDGVNLKALASHMFYIKYRTGVTIDNFISFNNKYFRVLDITNINEDNTILMLRCAERGDPIYEANWQ